MDFYSLGPDQSAAVTYLHAYKHRYMAMHKYIQTYMHTHIVDINKDTYIHGTYKNTNIGLLAYVLSQKSPSHHRFIIIQQDAKTSCEGVAGIHMNVLSSWVRPLSSAEGLVLVDP